MGGRGVVDLGLLADLSLVGSFLIGAGTFITLTFFSQPGGQTLMCQYHPFFSSSHSKMVNQFYFLAYASTDLEGRSNRGLGETTILSPSGGMREKPRLPTNSCSNEVITACQYLCIAKVQRPSLYESGTVTTLKRCLQKSKAVCHRKGLTEVGDSMRKEKSSGMS